MFNGWLVAATAGKMKDIHQSYWPILMFN